LCTTAEIKWTYPNIFPPHQITFGPVCAEPGANENVSKLFLLGRIAVTFNAGGRFKTDLAMIKNKRILVKIFI